MCPCRKSRLRETSPCFDIPEPEDNEISLSHPPHFVLKVRKETRSTRSLLVEWTAEVAADGEGLSRDRDGQGRARLRCRRDGSMNFPAVLSLHANIVNGEWQGHTWSTGSSG